ncbi:hypothetical protein T10_8914 [Trichinella papuae]|uniref:Uncharacterized protein n=1 Tax=Trichinella papuae TaxID=268474 RepID=A0A0V1LWD6_9BILA|nr:hypothetical protein T10_9946 [Trichinella papuae]KRZ63802.1 hypothetical protein T10_8914 [Trichinella papuae]
MPLKRYFTANNAEYTKNATAIVNLETEKKSKILSNCS